MTTVLKCLATPANGSTVSEQAGPKNKYAFYLSFKLNGSFYIYRRSIYSSHNPQNAIKSHLNLISRVPAFMYSNNKTNPRGFRKQLQPVL